MEEDRLQRLSGRWRLVKFDENFLAGGRRDEEEIDEGGVSAGSRGGVDGANRELVFEDLGGAIDVTATELDLLNAFAEFSEEAGDCAGAGRVAGGEDVKAHGVREVEFEFQSILIGRDIGEARGAVGFANFVEAVGMDRDAYGGLRKSSQKRGDFGVGEPGLDGFRRGGATEIKNPEGRGLADGSVAGSELP